jgi:hypothetical protein
MYLCLWFYLLIYISPAFERWLKWKERDILYFSLILQLILCAYVIACRISLTSRQPNTSWQHGYACLNKYCTKIKWSICGIFLWCTFSCQIGGILHYPNVLFSHSLIIAVGNQHQRPLLTKYTGTHFRYEALTSFVRLLAIIFLKPIAYFLLSWFS